MRQEKEQVLAGVRAQIAERDQQIAHKDALIAQLLQQAGKAGLGAANGAADGGKGAAAAAGAFFSKLRTSVARAPVRPLSNLLANGTRALGLTLIPRRRWRLLLQAARRRTSGPWENSNYRH